MPRSLAEITTSGMWPPLGPPLPPESSRPVSYMITICPPSRYQRVAIILGRSPASQLSPEFIAGRHDDAFSQGVGSPFADWFGSGRQARW